MLEDGRPALGALSPAVPETRVEREPDSGRRRSPVEPEGHGRRRLDARGFDSISDAELLAHLLALVARDADPDAAAGRLLQRWGDLAGVATATGPELGRLVAFHDHSGPLSLRLLWEMAARLTREEMVREPVLASSTGLLTYCTVRLARERVDQVRLLYLDGAQRLIADERHQSGTIGAVELHPREILRRAVELDALGIVVARGQAGRPARLTIKDRDDASTLEAAGRVLGLRLVDYLVIGRTGHASYRAGDRTAPDVAGSGRRSRR